MAVRYDHVWSKRDILEFNEIQKIPLILNPKDHCFRQSLDTACTHAGFQIQPIIELTDSKSILSLVKAGIGATILSSTLFSLENDRKLKAIKIVNPTIIREVTIVHHKHKQIGLTARGFIDLLITYVKNNRSNKGMHGS